MVVVSPDGDKPRRSLGRRGGFSGGMGRGVYSRSHNQGRGRGRGRGGGGGGHGSGNGTHSHSRDSQDHHYDHNNGGNDGGNDDGHSHDRSHDRSRDRSRGRSRDRNPRKKWDKQLDTVMSIEEDNPHFKQPGEQFFDPDVHEDPGEEFDPEEEMNVVVGETSCQTPIHQRSSLCSTMNLLTRF